MIRKCSGSTRLCTSLCLCPMCARSVHVCASKSRDADKCSTYLSAGSSYLDAGLGEARGLGQALSQADAGVRVRLEGGAQQLHVLLGEAGPLPATGAARGGGA